MTQRQTDNRFVLWLHEVDKRDVVHVGGKGASLGELTRLGIPVPPGFVVTADTYSYFLESAHLTDLIRERLTNLDTNDSAALAHAARAIQKAIQEAPLPEEVAREVLKAYQDMGGGAVAVRSSATAEDSLEASFAGQQSTFLNIASEKDLLWAVQACWASLFNERAIFYRCEQGFDPLRTGIAVPVQRMVQSQASGVMFTVEPLSNDANKMAIEAIFGLGEAIVSGAVTPDLYIVQKADLSILDKKVARQEWMLVRNPAQMGDPEDANLKADVPEAEQTRQKLTDDHIVELARIGRTLAHIYGYPQDIEWAMEDGHLYIVQSRPVTTLGELSDELLKKITAPVLVKGSGASPGLASGPVKVIMSAGEQSKVKKGDVLVTLMTTPDFVPSMKRAAAIVTDRGGRTCHAAIVSRELGVPCVVGTSNATQVLSNGQVVTVDGSQGLVYEGHLEVRAREDGLPHKRYKTRTRVLVNLADPELADVVAQRDCDGVGLLRAEFIIAHIGEHPRYMLEQGRGAEWTEKLYKGIEKFARAFYPRPVVYRTSDFKTNEYRNLKGGEKYEPQEENPMIGYRGCSRYLADLDTFRLETNALRRVCRKYPNVYVMIPFVRTPEEMAGIKAALEKEGLRRDKGLKLWMMVEVPSNAILLDRFIDVGLDGLSIGSNDLTQLVLGVDRDSSSVASLFDERHPAVLWALERVVTTAAARGITCSICGQAPSFYPELTEKLVEWGITSVSVSPDMIDRTREIVARVEKKKGLLPPQEEAEAEEEAPTAGPELLAAVGWEARAGWGKGRARPQ